MGKIYERNPIYAETAQVTDDIYEHSVTQEHAIGRRLITWDGRVFRYGRAATTTIEAGKGCKFYGTMADDGIALTSPAAQRVAGDRYMTVASETFAEDELRGGYACLYTASPLYQQMMILHNTYCSATTVTIDFDRALEGTLTTSNGIEVLPNPYRYMGYVNDTTYTSVAGVAMVSPTTAYYFWLQTWGICWINPGPYGQGGTAQERMVGWQTDGQLRCLNEFDNHNYQPAGFLVTRDASGTDSPPFVMLQVSI